MRAPVLGLLIAAAGCVVPHPPADPVSKEAPAGGENPPLRDAAEAAHKRIGTALMSARLNDPAVRALVARQFDSLSPENEMKWESVEPRPGAFAFAAGDRLVAFAKQNNLRMRGHTLVWHSQMPGWAKQLHGDELRAAMASHIAGVAGHWEGEIGAWDVVNEALADGPSGALREDSPFTALGADFIDQAFKLAHDADPNAQLFYNDYEIEGVGTPKSEAAYQLCKRLKEAGVPIGGVGFQMHVDPRHWPPPEAIKANIARYGALGLRVEFTEMDVPVGELPGSADQKLQEQRRIAHDIVATCVADAACTAVTFWGLTDRDSWLNDPHWGKLRGNGPHRPLLFDAQMHPKPIVQGVLDAFAGK
ncbi:MAG TPA: endo-1,4-beta-xylanase [Polyangia bacterium]|nr:endo-1,4-beta-xylanase [Polyangia bacterium]